MFDIKIQNGKEVFLFGSFDASQTEKVSRVFESINDNCVVDFKGLDYISSAGLGILVQNYSRLKELGKTIELINMNKHIKEVFKICKLDTVFLLK